MVGVHLVGGVAGTVLIGFFGFDNGAATPGGLQRGLFYGGGIDLLEKQVVAAGSVMLYSFVLTFVIGTVLKRLGAFRVSEEAEVNGIDEAEHAETAYSFSTVLSGGLTGQAAGAAASTSPTTREKVDA